MSFPCLRAVALQRAGVKTGIQVIRIRKYLDSCLRRNDENNWKCLHLSELHPVFKCLEIEKVFL